MVGTKGGLCRIILASDSLTPSAGGGEWRMANGEWPVARPSWPPDGSPLMGYGVDPGQITIRAIARITGLQTQDVSDHGLDGSVGCWPGGTVQVYLAGRPHGIEAMPVKMQGRAGHGRDKGRIVPNYFGIGQSHAVGWGWRMANGEWRMASGAAILAAWRVKWRMANGRWQMADGEWQMANGGRQTAEGGRRKAEGRWRKADGVLPLTTHHSPLTTHHSPLTTHRGQDGRATRHSPPPRRTLKIKN